MEKEVLEGYWERMRAQFASKAQIQALADLKQNMLTPGAGIRINNDVISSEPITEELVQIGITSNVAGVSVSGLTVNAYYNGSTEVSGTATTDVDGNALLRVPTGYTYRLEFPVIAGCEVIADIEKTASLVWRGVNVQYTTGLEQVEVYLRKQLTSSTEAVAGQTVSVTTGGTTTTYTTDSDGKVTFGVTIGDSYTVSAPKLRDWYVSRGEYTRTFVAAYESRGVEYTYKAYDSGLKVVDREGNEYTTEQFAAAIEAGTKAPNDAYLVKVATDALVSGSGCFAVRIDDIVNRGGGATWSGNNTLFNDIPANGNNSGNALYYNGLRASELIQAEGDTRNISTPAVDACLSQSITFGSVEHKGFLGAIGQWSVLWANRTAVDAIIALTRPNATNSLSNYTTQKWTSTQYSANYAWRWASSADNYTSKTFSYAVVPFFAY